MVLPSFLLVKTFLQACQVPEPRSRLYGNVMSETKPVVFWMLGSLKASMRTELVLQLMISPLTCSPPPALQFQGPDCLYPQGHHCWHKGHTKSQLMGHWPSSQNITQCLFPCRSLVSGIFPTASIFPPIRVFTFLFLRLLL